MASSAGYRARIEQLAADHRAQRERWLPQLPPELQALLPLDATPLAEGLELLADGAGIGAEVAAAQREQSRANAAVLHGRVFGRAATVPLATAHAAFADGARVRERLIGRVAEAIDGAGLRREAEALLAAAPVPPPEAFADAAAAGDDGALLGALEAAFAAQEHALLHCAARFDAILDG
ncbi:hypothetical protein [Conexibacter arvalis]|uniref:Uncharacterized protein n=1 Tax=Conexibacter arvalis TaxID=912552 RepID=A0A840IM46_9ACTN|nr:hypothetical protein [Conexibacter arvalis]MBB4665223.1 hypothetical protein [Conexibacter arvalis]